MVQEDDAEEEGPILMMGDEVYDDPREVVSGLPERALLSDFVESLPSVTKAVEKVPCTSRIVRRCTWYGTWYLSRCLVFYRAWTDLRSTLAAKALTGLVAYAFSRDVLVKARWQQQQRVFPQMHARQNLSTALWEKNSTSSRNHIPSVWCLA